MFASEDKTLIPDGGGCNGIKRVLYYFYVDSLEFVEEVENTIATPSPSFQELNKRMADKKAGVNKSEEIRKLAGEMKAKGEKPRPVVIIATLEKRGITVSSPQVSIVLKKMGFRPTRGRKAGRGVRKATVAERRPSAAGGSTVSVEEVLAAKKVAQQLGGTDKALAALTALKRIES